MSAEKVSILLVLLDPGMKLFIPREWVEREFPGERQPDIEMATLAFVHRCDLVSSRGDVRGSEAGYLFHKRLSAPSENPAC